MGTKTLTPFGKILNASVVLPMRILNMPINAALWLHGHEKIKVPDNIFDGINNPKTENKKKAK